MLEMTLQDEYAAQVRCGGPGRCDPVRLSTAPLRRLLGFNGASTVETMRVGNRPVPEASQDEVSSRTKPAMRQYTKYAERLRQALGLPNPQSIEAFLRNQPLNLCTTHSLHSPKHFALVRGSCP